MDITQFVSWESLSTYGGALIMVGIITQFVKDVGFVKKMPTQLVTYILSFIVLIVAQTFLGTLDLAVTVATIFNAILVSIGSNGGYSLMQRISHKTDDSD